MKALLLLSLTLSTPSFAAPTVEDCEKNIAAKISKIANENLKGRLRVTRLGEELKSVHLEPAFEGQNGHKLFYLAKASGETNELHYLVVATMHSPNTVFSKGCSIEYITNLHRDESFLSITLNKELGLN